MLSMGALSIIGLLSYKRLKDMMKPSNYNGRISGANFSRGHLLRDPKFPSNPSKSISIDTLIIGAGVSGLSCAWELSKNNKDFILIDLDYKVGGNSVGSINDTGEFPLGAHYLPIPGKDAPELKQLLIDLGITKNKDINSLEYDDLYLCHDLKERLFIHGRWQEGLVPEKGLNEFDKSELIRFFKLMQEYQVALGDDNKRAFTIPLERSSKDQQYRQLDNNTMSEFLNEQDFKSEYLLWYVDYCCRDDYGAGIKDVSAWAGIHYFAAREDEELLTWPEGNYFLIKRMLQHLQKNIALNKILFSVEKKGKNYKALVYDFQNKQSIEYVAKNIVYAAPSFSAKNIFKIESISNQLSALNKEYVPWMSANIELEAYNDWGNLDVAWDNVNYHGRSLGYVNSSHQNINTRRVNVNLTQYWDLKNIWGKKARLKALHTTHQEWCQLVIDELKLTHPEIIPHIKKVDIGLWGHAMAIPKKGFLDTISKQEEGENIYFAHTDINYISLFEQGFYQGYFAAQKVLENG